jgi:hypothetical protein
VVVVGEERKDGFSLLLSQTRGFRRLHRIPKWKLVPELRVSTLLCTLVSSHGTIFPPPSQLPFFFSLSLTLTQLSLFSRVTTEAGMLMLENQFWPLFFGWFFFWHPIYSSRKHSRVSNVVVLKEGGEGGG